MKRFKISFEAQPDESPIPAPAVSFTSESPSVDTTVASVKEYFGCEVTGKRVAVWGLTNPQSNDRLDHATLAIVERLIDAGLRVAVHDPIAMELARTHLADCVEFCQTQWQAASRSHAVIVTSAWSCYRYVDPGYYQWHACDTAIFDIPDCVELGSNLGGTVPHFAFGKNGLVERCDVVRFSTNHAASYSETSGAGGLQEAAAAAATEAAAAG